MMKAASSALPDLHRAVAGRRPAAAAPPVSVPKPPSSTLMMLRFMPLHMM